MPTNVVFSGQFPVGETVTDTVVIPSGTSEVMVEVQRTGWPNTTDNILMTSIQCLSGSEWVHKGGGTVNGEGNEPKFEEALVFDPPLASDATFRVKFNAYVPLQTVVRFIY